MACHHKHKKKTYLFKLENFTFFKTVCFLFQNPLKNEKIHKRYPFAGPCICNYKLELAFAINKQPFGLTRVFSFLLPFLNCGWMVLNQNPMKIPSEPIRKERICQNLTRFFALQLQSRTPPKKKGRGGFTIVDAPLPPVTIHFNKSFPEINHPAMGGHFFHWFREIFTSKRT